MYEKRGQYKSYEHNGTVVATITEFDKLRSGISEVALREGMSRVQYLHTLRVLGWRLSGKQNHFLTLYLYIPNAVLNDAESEARIDQYMQILQGERRCFWHRPSYRGEELRNVSTFMHDLNWYICERTYNLSERTILRPRVYRRFVCLEMHPERLPWCIGETAIADIQRGLAKLMPEVTVQRAQGIACDGFTLGSLSDMGNYPVCRRRRKNRSRYDGRYTEFSELERMLKEWQEEYDEKVRAATQNWLTELLDDLASVETLSGCSYFSVQSRMEMSVLPVKLMLALASKGIKYMLYCRMLARWRKEEKEKTMAGHVAEDAAANQ